MSNAVTLLGYFAGILTTIAFVPQVVQTVRTRSTKDISLAMFGTFCVGVACWLIYGVLIGSSPVIWANAVTLMLATLILAMKIRYK